MQLYLITGDKGGVGKSLISAFISDYIYRNAIDNKQNKNFLFCDCDKREDGQSSFTRLTLCLNDTDDVHIERKFYELDTIDGFASLFADVCKSNFDSVVADTGANMLFGLNENYRLLNQYSTKFSDIKIKVIFIIASTCDSSFAAKSYLESFFNCKNISTTFVLNHDKNKRKISFDFLNDELLQKVINDFNNNNELSKIKIVNYGYIPETIFNISSFDSRDVKLPYKILYDENTNPAIKILYELWLSDSDEVMKEIII